MLYLVYNRFMDMHEQYMRAALKEAKKAAKKDEVPVGAVIVKDGKIIARGHNLREKRKQPDAHAEMIVIKKAAKKLGGWRLTGCTLYVTLEPCPMCAGTVINARVDSVVFGAYDSKAGAFGSLYDLSEGKLNHHPSVTGGVLHDDCAGILKSYFKAKRQKRPKRI